MAKLKSLANLLTPDIIVYHHQCFPYLQGCPPSLLAENLLIPPTWKNSTQVDSPHQKLISSLVNNNFHVITQCNATSFLAGVITPVPNDLICFNLEHSRALLERDDGRYNVHIDNMGFFSQITACKFLKFQMFLLLIL